MRSFLITNSRHDATDVKGVILSGSPYSVYDENAFKADLTEIRGKYPVLGICYGAQFLAYTSGGNVEPANSREYGRANLSHIDGEDELLKGIHVVHRYGCLMGIRLPYCRIISR